MAKSIELWKRATYVHTYVFAATVERVGDMCRTYCTQGTDWHSIGQAGTRAKVNLTSHSRLPWSSPAPFPFLLFFFLFSFTPPAVRVAKNPYSKSNLSTLFFYHPLICSLSNRLRLCDRSSPFHIPHSPPCPPLSLPHGRPQPCHTP